MPYLLFLAALAFAASPFLTSGFGGFDADQFPVPQVDPPGQPAGYAFGIWGLIYLWLIVGTGFQMLRRKDAEDWVALRLPLLVSLGIGIFWLPVAMISPLWATVLIWAMLAGALSALLRCPARDSGFAAWPVGLYAGWLTAAASVSLALIGAGWGLMSGTTAALMALVIALLLSLAMMWQRPSVIGYPVAVIWALIAVAVANWPDGPRSVLLLAAAGAVLIGIVAAFMAARRQA